MTRFEVDKAFGQTPCLCGDLERWHPGCYSGKNDEQFIAATARSYEIARRELRKRANKSMRLLIGLVRT